MRIFIAVAALSLVASPLYAATATVSASAQVLQPLAITTTQALSFAKIVPPASGSVPVTINPDGSTVGPVIGTATAAHFTITGEPSQVVNYAASPTINLDGPNSQTIVASTIAPGNTVTLTGGTANVNIGATFMLPSTAYPGAYSGTFTITANYQ